MTLAYLAVRAVDFLLPLVGFLYVGPAIDSILSNRTYAPLLTLAVIPLFSKRFDNQSVGIT